MKAWFVSDIHITGPDDLRLKQFEAFLAARLTDETTHVFLVGDIFDLWVGGHEFFGTRYQGVVKLIRQLREHDIDVIYFEGNHDLHLEKMWAEQLHCRVFVAPEYFDLGPFRVRVEHGDQMNPDDTGYHFLRAVLRTPQVEWLAHTLPGSVLQKVGNTMSRSSRKWTSSSMKARNEEAIRGMIHAHAERALKEDEPFDFIITGHVHIRDDFTWKGATSIRATGETSRDVRSINLGCWLTDEAPQAFCLDDRGGRWVELAAAAN